MHYYESGNTFFARSRATRLGLYGRFELPMSPSSLALTEPAAPWAEPFHPIMQFPRKTGGGTTPDGYWIHDEPWIGNRCLWPSVFPASLGCSGNDAQFVTVVDKYIPGCAMWTGPANGGKVSVAFRPWHPYPMPTMAGFFVVNDAITITGSIDLVFARWEERAVVTRAVEFIVPAGMKWHSEAIGECFVADNGVGWTLIGPQSATID